MSGFLAQATLASEGRLEGVGLHSGRPAEVVLRPAPAGSGLQFLNEGRPVAPAMASGESARCTTIGEGPESIRTVEHLAAAASGLGISNLRVDVRGGEVPVLDGSAEPFVRLFKSCGVKVQNEPREVYRVREPIFCAEPGKAIAIFPSEDFRIAYTMDYRGAGIPLQCAEFAVTPEIFERELAPARTFCTEKEAGELRGRGFGLGASEENTVVIRPGGQARGPLRFADEPLRHKILDIIGDLGLLGYAVQGRIVAIRSGHALNRRLAEAIQKQRDAMTQSIPNADIPSIPMDIGAIQKILPHRYPFLLVDRVIEMEEERIVGIKNVSINEAHFVGHFPKKPVMPGVLIVEAMAQVGGILMLTKPQYRGKLAYLAGIQNARFRKVVQPGDQLRMEARLTKLRAKVGTMNVVALVDGEEACSAELLFALGE